MMTKRDIAGLFMTHYSDRAWDDPQAERERVRREVSSLGVAGYCVFGGEIGRTGALNAAMEEAAGGPLLVASDLEQGLGQQLLGGTVFPSQMAVGATGSTGFAEEVGRAVALEARSVGINVVFAPVADVATEPSNPIIGVRAYGASPRATAELVAAYVRGCQSAGVAATAKHFPGHGDTAVDSHIDLPVVTAERNVLDERELVPFRAAIAAGVRVVMTGHIAFPALAGADVPATLAPSIGETLLRGELGFQGLVVTDALLMGAVAKRHGPGDAAVMALAAGADLLLMPEDLGAAVDGVVAAVGSGAVSRERVERSLERIALLKTWLAAARDDAASPGDANARAGSGAAVLPAAGPAHDELARDVALHAVTLVSNDGVVPIEPGAFASGSVLVAALVDPERPPDLEGLTSLLAARMPEATLRTLSGEAQASELESLVSDARGVDAFVLLAFDQPAAWRGRKGPPASLASAARRALAAAPRSVAVIFAGPELVPLFEGSGALLCCYDGSPHMQRAALDVLLGDAQATGTLPAPIPG
ncbi:MAG: glycoside hydrolase family 3 N-terminal domain-containing protein [Candidatus Eisenbacteria bacterium]